MAGNQHDGVVQLFRGHPELITRLLGEMLGVAVPEHVRTTVTESVLGKLAPPPLTADLVAEMVDAENRPQLVTILEAQGRIDPEKLLSWPTYQTLARYSRRCDACVLVVTWEEDVEEWASRPIRLGPGNDEFRVHVLGPRRIPPILDPAVAAADPTLALLTYMAHGNEAGGVEVLYTTAQAVLQVDRENYRVYAELLFRKVSGALRAALKAKVAEMQGSTESELPDVLQWLVDQGETKGQAKALLKILEVRGVVVTPEQREQVLKCKDEGQLEDWLARAALAKTADDVFA